ncbi:MAG: SDR family oxidoreductase [Firmicutes bacterium]|nr:SDR family oxidoreductase [Bacillota bacterium]
MGKLENKVCIVTGASGGLGKQTAIRFAEEGAIVCICARTEEALKETERICKEKGADVLAMTADVSDPESLKAFVGAIAEKYGRVDALCNNASTISAPHPFIEHTIEDLEEALHSGLYGTWTMMQLCFPLMKDNGGAILNYGSDGGVSGLPGFAAYATEKEAIRGLSRVVAREWGRFNIRVNCLCPKVATDRFLMGIEYSPVEMQEYLKASMTSDVMGRMGMAYEDATPVIAFLVSDEAGWITGQTIHVEGGDWISA